MTRPQLYVPCLHEKEQAALFGSAACSCYADRPNNAVNSGRIVASLVEWHLLGVAQPLAITMNEGVCLAVEVDAQHIQRRLETGYCDEMASTLDEALHQVREAVDQGQPLSIGLIGNAAEVYPELVRRGIRPDVVKIKPRPMMRSMAISLPASRWKRLVSCAGATRRPTSNDQWSRW